MQLSYLLAIFSLAAASAAKPIPAQTQGSVEPRADTRLVDLLVDAISRRGGTCNDGDCDNDGIPDSRETGDNGNNCNNWQNQQCIQAFCSNQNNWGTTVCAQFCSTNPNACFPAGKTPGNSCADGDCDNDGIPDVWENGNNGNNCNNWQNTQCVQNFCSNPNNFGSQMCQAFCANKNCFQSGNNPNFPGGYGGGDNPNAGNPWGNGKQPNGGKPAGFNPNCGKDGVCGDDDDNL